MAIFSGINGASTSLFSLDSIICARFHSKVLFLSLRSVIIGTMSFNGRREGAFPKFDALAYLRRHFV